MTCSVPAPYRRLRAGLPAHLRRLRQFAYKFALTRHSGPNRTWISLFEQSLVTGVTRVYNRIDFIPDKIFIVLQYGGA